MSYDKIRRGKDPYADADAVQAILEAQGIENVGGYINQTDLLAPTAQNYMVKKDGKLNQLRVIVRTAVTTGGPITVSKNGTLVTGLSVTVTDGATAGTEFTDTPTSETFVKAGDLITITPDASFATAGAVSAFVEVDPSALS